MKTQTTYRRLPMLSRLSLFLLSTLLPGSLLALAQETGGVGRIKLNSVNTTSSTAPQKNVVQRRKPSSAATKGKVFTTTTGALSVASESQAMIFIKPLNGKDFIDKEAIAANKGQVIFDNLPPGQYQVVAELDGYKDANGAVTIKAGGIEGLTLRLEPELYTVTIKTNVRGGEVRYRLNAKGEIPNVVPLRSNGQALISNLTAGEYEVDVRAADAAYKPLPALITVGKDKTEFEVNLERVLCEQTFSEAWASLNGWVAPAAWAVSGRKLGVKSTGVALPKDECPRHFANFELTSDVRFLNDFAASFVLRAQNEKNYYLVQLTGAKADEPFVLRGYVVTDGRKQQLGGSVPIDAFSQSMTGKFFTVLLQAKDNVFTISINDSDTGDVLPLGKLTDPGKHFALGANGLGASTMEQFEVARFIVKPLR